MVERQWGHSRVSATETGWVFQLIDLTDNQKDDEGDDNELDDGVQKDSIVDSWRSSCLSVSQAGEAFATDVPIQAGKIHFPKEQPDGWHDDIVDK